MINPMELTGKHVIITGGSSGIGRQCAIQASQLGARVTMIARDEKRLQEALHLMEYPEKHACYSFDLSKTDEIDKLIKMVISQRGRVDGLCHSAGIATMRMIKQTNPPFVEKMLRIHALAFIELVRCLSLKDNLNDGASLVGISSLSAVNGEAAQTAYAAAKACMNGFLHPASLELAPRKIRINTVAYGTVLTPMFYTFVENGGNIAVTDKQMLGKIDVKSAANVVTFLLSDACKYITGSVLPVYAGY